MFTLNLFDKNEQIMAEQEFKTAMSQHAEQVYAKKPEDVNAVLGSEGQLNKEQVWQGLKWKAETPEKFVGIIQSAVIPESIKKLSPTEMSFIRLSIQKSFATGNIVLVNEEVFIDDAKKRVLFLGREINDEVIQQAKEHLSKFQIEMLAEKPALFHVEHAVIGTNESPIATWKMVRLSDQDPRDKLEAERITGIRNLISGLSGKNIYLQTIKQLDENPVKVQQHS